MISGRHLCDGKHIELRIRERLPVVGARAVVAGLAKCFGVGRIDEARLDSHVARRHVEEIIGSAVDVCRADEVVACLREVLDRVERRSLAGGDGQRGRPAFHRREALLEDIRGRIHDSRVDVPELREREQIRGVLRVAELVAGGLIDRHGDGARGRI
jgi:hypothetical protein